jgi:hypothetical protein
MEDTVSGKPKQSERSMLQRHILHPESHMDWPQIATGPLWWHLADKKRMAHGMDF